MILGIDLHDTITYQPNFFQKLINNWDDDVYIVSGTPESKREEVINKLEKFGISGYKKVLLGYEYVKEGMTSEHFQKMKEHKLKLLKEHGVQVYFDDNPIYVEHIRKSGILVFQPILNDEYIDEFSKKDKYFTCHLQKNQFKNIN